MLQKFRTKKPKFGDQIEKLQIDLKEAELRMAKLKEEHNIGEDPWNKIIEYK